MLSVKEEFFDNCWYNGHPRTENRSWQVRLLADTIGLERAIIYAIQELDYHRNLLSFVINPTPGILLEAIRTDHDNIKYIPEPSIEIILEYLQRWHYGHEKYRNQLTREHYLTLCLHNTYWFQFVDTTTITPDEAWKLIQAQPSYLQHFSAGLSEDQIVRIIPVIRHHDNVQISWIPMFTDRIVSAILRNYSLAVQFLAVPEQYHTDDNFKLALTTTWGRFSIPPDRMTEEQAEYLVLHGNKGVNDLPEKFQTKEFTQRMLSKTTDWLRVFLNSPFQDDAGWLRAVKTDPMLIDQVPVVTPVLLHEAAQSQKHLPRRERYWFVEKLSVPKQLECVKISSFILGVFKVQSDQLIRSALFADGYAIQYVINQTKEFQQLALASEPKSIKYFRSL